MGKIRLYKLDENRRPLKTEVMTLNKFNTHSFEEKFMEHGGSIMISFDKSDELVDTTEKLYELINTEDKIKDLNEKAPRRTIKHKWNGDWVNYRKEFIKDVTEKSDNDQDKLILALRKEGFIFLDSTTLLDRFPELIKKISKVKLKKYQWMVRLLKEGITPEKDSFDPYVLFGITISPKRKSKTVVYLDKRFLYSINMDIPKRLDGVKAKPVQLVKYPDWMDYKERQKWGSEHRKLLADKELKPSKFYTIYNQDIIVKGYLVIISLNNKHDREK